MQSKSWVSELQFRINSEPNGSFQWISPYWILIRQSPLEKCGEQLISLSTGQNHNVYTHQRLPTLPEEKESRTSSQTTGRAGVARCAQLSVHLWSKRDSAWVLHDLLRNFLNGINIHWMLTIHQASRPWDRVNSTTGIVSSLVRMIREWVVHQTSYVAGGWVTSSLSDLPLEELSEGMGSRCCSQTVPFGPGFQVWANHLPLLTLKSVVVWKETTWTPSVYRAYFLFLWWLFQSHHDKIGTCGRRPSWNRGLVDTVTAQLCGVQSAQDGRSGGGHWCHQVPYDHGRSQQLQSLHRDCQDISLQTGHYPLFTFQL